MRFVEQGHIDPVLQCTLVQGEHALVLHRVRGHDQFAALLVTNVVVLAETQGFRDASAAELCFEAAGLVVDAGMYNPAVVAGLVPSHGLLLLDHDNAFGRLSLAQLPGDGKSDNAAANDRKIVH